MQLLLSIWTLTGGLLPNLTSQLQVIVAQTVAFSTLSSIGAVVIMVRSWVKKETRWENTCFLNNPPATAKPCSTCAAIACSIQGGWGEDMSPQASLWEQTRSVLKRTCPLNGMSLLGCWKGRGLMNWKQKVGEGKEKSSLWRVHVANY